MTHNIMVLDVMTLSIMTLSTITFKITTLYGKTFNKMTLKMTFKKSVNLHNLKIMYFCILVIQSSVIRLTVVAPYKL
jgi:hypothetical protein